MPRAGFEPATCPLGGDCAILCATEAWSNDSKDSRKAQLSFLLLSAMLKCKCFLYSDQNKS